MGVFVDDEIRNLDRKCLVPSYTALCKLIEGKRRTSKSVSGDRTEPVGYIDQFRSNTYREARRKAIASVFLLKLLDDLGSDGDGEIHPVNLGRTREQRQLADGSTFFAILVKRGHALNQVQEPERSRLIMEASAHLTGWLRTSQLVLGTEKMDLPRLRCLHELFRGHHHDLMQAKAPFNRTQQHTIEALVPLVVREARRYEPDFAIDFEGLCTLYRRWHVPFGILMLVMGDFDDAMFSEC